jgi:hypothetical protein
LQLYITFVGTSNQTRSMPPNNWNDVKLEDMFCLYGIYFTGYELLKELDMIEEHLLEKPGAITDEKSPQKETF